MEPQLAIGAEMPIPMKLKKASVKMAFGTRKVLCTMIGTMALISRWRNRILASLAQMTSAAMENSCAFKAISWPLT
mgnify:CR=1 FL=1